MTHDKFHGITKNIEKNTRHKSRGKSIFTKIDIFNKRVINKISCYNCQTSIQLTDCDKCGNFLCYKCVKNCRNCHKDFCKSCGTSNYCSVCERIITY